MKKILEESVNNERFSMTPVFTVVFSEGPYNRILAEVLTHCNPQVSKHILQSILRFSFFIEPVKQPKIETTKFTIRWSDSLNFDPRQCTYENCLEIFDYLIHRLLETISIPEYQTLLSIISNHTLISYEINIDYINRIQHKAIHTCENIDFFWDDYIRKVYLLRSYLLNPGNHDYIKFFSDTYEKIAVKSFLTDRVLTGAHKTNREKRWECHPDSVHFALRKECLAIESKLINQICHFEDFPKKLRDLLSNDNVIRFKDEVTKCPITLDPINFEKFQYEIINPVHGKSSFQVGHLHPLKSLEDSDFSGHS
ncbi:MAG: hypothetical protein NTZ85_03590 [Bacteroidia bacterium]|nr:hypothetical protein [Bacteroidia bacterium]